ncbi:LamG domain-containing protein, partial [bacterium]|nr:LamG domain-containing protein [bacterium]
LNIYEEIPFSVSLQMETNLKVTTLDNISSWNLTENFFIRTSIVELYDPEFKIHANKNISIRPFEYFGSYMNWTLGTFKEVLDNSYSSIYYDTDYKYSLGNSFLNRLLNYKVSSYDSTVLYLSFVHDDFEKGIYDSSLYNDLGDLYANTRILYTFNNDTINSSINQIYDLSSYNNSGKISNVPINASSCVNSECAFFTTNSKINISDSKNLLNISDTFSFSLWFKLDAYTQSASILSYNKGGFGNTTQTNDGFLLSLTYNDPTQLRFIVGNTSELNSVRTNISLSLDSWNHVVGIFDKGKLELYLNGILSGRVYTSFTNLKYLDKNLLLGKANYISHPSFNGSLDEFAFYSKALNLNEIAYLYGQREAKFIDYADSLNDKGIYFDGIDDYLKIDLNDSLDNFMNDSFSIEFWLKTNNFDVYDILNYTSELYIGLNNSNLVFGDDVTNKINIPIEFIPVIYNYVVITYDNASKILKVYNNGKLKNQSVFNLNSTLDGGDLFVGGKNNFFRGIIDEIKFSKKILSSKDIENLYFNYRSFSGGCCNYISLINPNLLGYNTSNFDDLNISYSSRLFFDNISMNNFLPNITLFNVTNITSSETFKNYYQFKVDT